MNQDSTDAWIAKLTSLHPDLEICPPAPASNVSLAEEKLGVIPPELAALYRATNGLENRSFRILPVFDEARTKKTWDSLQRLNDPATTRALAGDRALLGKFLVFADIGNGYAMINRSDGRIWFEELNQVDVKETDLTFREFVEIMLANAE
jgi:hypothetical protein